MSEREATRRPVFAEAVVAAAVRAAEEKLAEDVVELDLTGRFDAFDRLVVMNGRNDRHVRSIADDIEEAVAREVGVRPHHVEGLSAAEWVAMDYGDVIVHVFDEAARDYYDLEHLWGEATVRRRAVAR